MECTSERWARARAFESLAPPFPARQEQGKKAVPRRIWFLWFQGLERAPYVVKRCYESWAKRNDAWELCFLSYENVSDWLDLDLNSERFSRLSRNHLANIVRTSLLASFGGVWADATCFCVRGLDTWIDEVTTSGFFAFASPGRDRLISNWFLAANPGNRLMERWSDEHLRYWGEHDFRNWRSVRYGIRALLGWNSRTPGLWFSPLLQDYLRLCPYYAAHYMFQSLIRSEPECREIWDTTTRVKAEIGHRLQRVGLDAPLSLAIRREIDEQVAPVYKLSWKRAEDRPIGGSILEYLLGSLEDPIGP